MAVMIISDFLTVTATDLDLAITASFLLTSPSISSVNTFFTSQYCSDSLPLLLLRALKIDQNDLADLLPSITVYQVPSLYLCRRRRISITIKRLRLDKRQRERETSILIHNSHMLFILE